ncbi:MAG: hypothetical protein L0G99_11830 [Propionibacteriales bacterium]|nr:hypothetical protein [Propionibacteriales bacterium]
MTVEATVAGNQRATDLLSAELRRRGWLVVPPRNDLADAVMLVKAMKVVGGRPATMEMIAAMYPVQADKKEPTFQASVTFRFVGEG